MNPETNENDQLETLEDPGSAIVSEGTVNEPAASDPQAAPPAPASAPGPLPKPKLTNRLKTFLSRLNIYLLGFILVFVLVGIGIIFAVRFNSSDDDKSALPTDTLTPEELSRLQNTDATVGDPKQTLTIESNTVINGKVLLRDDLDVAGTIKVGGSLTLPGITVSGTSNFDQIQASRLSITGDTTIQGQLNVQRNLTVSGSASFGGSVSAAQLNIQTLQLSGDLQLNRHIDTGGGTPSKSDGSGLGSGGTSSVSGSDTAGTVTINTGSGPSSGCYITVNFAQRFNATPHVVITPVGTGGAALNYYVNRSTTSFSICSTNAPASGTSFSFDYVALD